MKNMIIYLGQVIIISGLLYGYYHFFLRNKKFHHYNRYYLLSATLLSLVIPFLNIPVYFTEPDVRSSFVLETLTQLSPSNVESSDISSVYPLSTEASSFDWMLIPKMIFAATAIFLLTRLIISLIKIRRIIRKNPVEKIETIKFVNTLEPGTPYSFFRWLFWNRNIEVSSEKGRQIFRHELFHINQKHSIDILFMEIIFLLFFLNPFFWLIKKELRIIHEFLADRYAVKENDDKWQYAELLLMQTLNTRQSLVNPFFHNQIKRRIAMITNSQKPGHRYLRKLMVLPLAFLAFLLFAFKYQYKNQQAVGIDKRINVVIDAGHGGTDAGAIAEDGTEEKDITLSLAKKIKDINADENIRILLTRDNDVLSNLKARTEFCNNQKADLFISLHVNSSTDKSKTSFEIISTPGNKSSMDQDKLLASVLRSSLKEAYPGEIILGTEKTKIWVLENTNCPSVMLGCGYMSNEKELAFIKDPFNQDNIAAKILSAIASFARQQKIDLVERKEQRPADTIKPQRVDDSKKIYDKVEVEPAFPGGPVKWREFLQRNLKVMVPLEKKAPEGIYTVIIQFIVDTDGKLSDIKALTNHGYGMEEEALRVIRIGPTWTPGTQNGLAVKSYKKQAITFQITDEQSTSIKQAPQGELTVYNSTHFGQEEQRTIRFDLDPRTFYVGLDNILTVKSNFLQTDRINATISNGTIEKKENNFIIHVNDVSEKIKVNFYIDNNGGKELIKEMDFSSKTFPPPSKSAMTTPNASTTSSSIPKDNVISASQLRRSTVTSLLKLPEETEVVSFTFTIDKEKEIVAVPNTGNQLNQATMNLINSAESGRLITIDLIKIRKDGAEKRIPSRIWYVTD